MLDEISVADVRLFMREGRGDVGTHLKKKKKIINGSPCHTVCTGELRSRSPRIYFDA